MPDEQITTTDAPIGLDDLLIAQAVGKPYVLIALGQYPNGDTKVELSMKEVDDADAVALMRIAAHALLKRAEEG